MKNPLPRLGLLLLPLLLVACVTQDVKNKASVESFRQAVTGNWVSDTGAELSVFPVRARMVSDEAIYLERRQGNDVFGRLINVEMSPDGKRMIQRAMTFTQDGQWRNISEQPELLTALLPKDVRPAGTCDIKVSGDANSVTYSCGGSAPETFRRRP